MNAEEFVRARLADEPLPDEVATTYRRLLDLSDRIRKDGETNDTVSWFTGTAAIMKAGEYLLGLDPATDAARIRNEVHVILAATWRDHADYDPAWSTGVKALDADE